MDRFRFGLTAFADPWLQRRLYPQASGPAMLPAYADRFSLWEMECTARPEWTAVHSEAILDQAPPGLLLLPRMAEAVSKHTVRADPAVLERWCEAVRPLLRSRRCGPVLVPWYGPQDPGSEAALEQVLDRVWQERGGRGGIAVEFRDPTWFQGDALRLLEEHQAGLVWSTLAGLVPFKVTADFLYIRITGTQGRRIPDEVGGLLGRLRARSGDRRPVYVVATRAGEAYSLRALERFARGCGRTLDLVPVMYAQQGLDAYVQVGA